MPFPSPGNLLTQSLNLHLLHCRQTLDHWATYEAPPNSLHVYKQLSHKLGIWCDKWLVSLRYPSWFRCKAVKYNVRTSAFLNWNTVDLLQFKNNSVIHTHMYMQFSGSFPLKVLLNIEYSLLCYTTGPWGLCILHIPVCICEEQLFLNNN